MLGGEININKITVSLKLNRDFANKITIKFERHCILPWMAICQELFGFFAELFLNL